jgi:Phosphoribosyl-ATP pyrophosphohydrolase
MVSWEQLDELREGMAADAAEHDSSLLLGYATQLGEILTSNQPLSRQHAVQRDVVAFFRHVGGLVGETPGIRNPQLNADLILEEARETAESITGRKVKVEVLDEPSKRPRSLVGAIDGLCDQLATIYGAAITFGVDLAPFWAEVNRTNMAKQGGPTRQDGKQLKPPGWEPPDLAIIFTQLYPGVCRECGCTPERACWHMDLGGCAWAEPGLCTACTPDAGDDWEHPPSLEEVA